MISRRKEINGTKEILAIWLRPLWRAITIRRRRLQKKLSTNEMDPLKAVEEGLSKGMATVGEKFEKGEVFLPELLMAADTFNAAMEILKPEIEAQKKADGQGRDGSHRNGKSDVHNIGKNIVATVLETHGFEVVRLGMDNPSLNFIEEAEKVKADVIALSSLMTTTMPGQKK